MGERKPIGKRCVASLNKNRNPKQFYFIEPQEGRDARDVAEALINIESVEEVYVADGDYGFLVKAKSEDKRDLQRFLDRRFSNRYGMMTAYYNYKK